MDEAHLDVSSNSKAISIFRGIGKHVRKWMVTGTPFESSSATQVKTATYYTSIEVRVANADAAAGLIKLLKAQDWKKEAFFD